MSYEAELHFLLDTFEKCHLQTMMLNPSEPLDKRIELGVESAESTFYDVVPEISSSTIYRMTDFLMCCYTFLLLPDREQPTVLFIGPYLTEGLTHMQIMERAEKLGVPPHNVPELEKYYKSIPIVTEDSGLFAMLDVFGEKIWGGSEKFTTVNIDQEHLGGASPLATEWYDANPKKAVFNMQIMEKRYAYENEMMLAVSQGQIHKAERLLGGFSAVSYEERITDPVRNMKNYSIIMNTLLRKAAENGGVHPVYLDSVSSDFAKRIEGMNATSDILTLMKEMFRSYCRLVRKHSIRQYSPPVQKAITYIDSDLTADLSLSALASIQNVSAGYLSALFKQETGQTLTEHVNQKRIKHAMQLLKTTQLQIQTIAQYCGIVDVHYFSKMFKKYVGKTPKEYREKT